MALWFTQELNRKETTQTQRKKKKKKDLFAGKYNVPLEKKKGHSYDICKKDPSLNCQPKNIPMDFSWFIFLEQNHPSINVAYFNRLFVTLYRN